MSHFLSDRFVTANVIGGRTAVEALEATTHWLGCASDEAIIRAIPRSNSSPMKDIRFLYLDHCSVDLKRECERFGVRPADPYLLAAAYEARLVARLIGESWTYWYDGSRRYLMYFSRGRTGREVVVQEFKHRPCFPLACTQV